MPEHRCAMYHSVPGLKYARRPGKGSLPRNAFRAGVIHKAGSTSGDMTMAFELPALPYAKDALAPHMSAETLEFHYGKHHQTYVTKLNELIAGTDKEGQSLEDIIKGAGPGPLFNNAAQVWNHTFFWNSLSPNGGGDPAGALA